MAFTGNFRNRESDNDLDESDDNDNETDKTSKPINSYDLKKICNLYFTFL